MNKNKYTYALIVVIFVAVLYVALLPNGIFGTPKPIREKSKTEKTKMNICSLNIAIEEYFTEHDNVPDTGGGLIEALIADGLSRSTIKDAWENDILIIYDGTQVIEIRSGGLDGVYNTSDDLFMECCIAVYGNKSEDQVTSEDNQ